MGAKKHSSNKQPVDMQAVRAVQEALDIALRRFPQSKEGRSTGGIGFWAGMLVLCGFDYYGVTLWEMTPAHVEQIIMKSFPAEAGVNTMEDAQRVTAELQAFWKFLQRKYALENASAVLDYLIKIGPIFTEVIYNAPDSVEARKMIAAGESAGFDMNDEEQAERFMDLYWGPLFPEEGPSLLNRSAWRMYAKKRR